MPKNDKSPKNPQVITEHDFTGVKGAGKRCMYEALGRAEGKQAVEIYNAAQATILATAYEWDDSELFPVLAKQFRFANPQYIGDVDLGGFSDGTDLLFVICTDKKPPAKSVLQSNPESALTDSKYHDLEWHCIYGKVGQYGAIAYQDNEQKRNNGLLAKDTNVIIYTRKSGAKGKKT